MPSEKVKEMQSILIDIEMPQKLTNLRSVLTLLAMAKLTNDKNWKQTSEDYSRIHDLIAFIGTEFCLLRLMIALEKWLLCGLLN